MTGFAQVIEPKGLVVPAYEAIPTKLLRLRWRFDFAGKPTKRGVWDAASGRPEDAAWMVDKTGLVLAAIEGEHRDTQEEMTLVECQGQDFALFQWEAYARCPGLGMPAVFTPRTNVAGLSLLTRDEKITVWINGQWERKPLSAEEKEFNFHEHSV